jgi:starch synthase
MITRLVDQKGIYLLKEVLKEILSLGVQLVILGTGDPHYEDLFRSAAKNFPTQMSANITFDQVLAQRIYAGSDMYLMPSQFEPCGLGQLIALRYGSIPIVRQTGGLNDTVQSYNADTGLGNGFSFVNCNPQQLLQSVKEAVSIYRQPLMWQRIINNAMKADYSWTQSATEYKKIYRKLIYPKASV